MVMLALLTRITIVLEADDEEILLVWFLQIYIGEYKFYS